MNATIPEYYFKATLIVKRNGLGVSYVISLEDFIAEFSRIVKKTLQKDNLTLTYNSLYFSYSDESVLVQLRGVNLETARLISDTLELPLTIQP